MYLKSLFSETRVEVLREHVRSYPLATFIVCLESTPVANHMPFFWADDGSELGVLKAHIPRANGAWEACDGSLDALVVFHGPNAYVSPSWYPSKREHGMALPTWNYVVAQVRGRPEARDDRAWLLEHLRELTEMHEAAQPEPWQVSDAPEAFLEEMVGHLVGIEMPVESISGKWKLSQNRPLGDRAGVAEALETAGDDVSNAIARLVRERMQEAS